METLQKELNRIDHALQKKRQILNVYFTAGYPHLDDTVRIAKTLQEAGADMLEIGIPFSDPLADGPTIQESSARALHNGMTLATLFQQLHDLRKEVDLPVLLMGYLNPIVQFGLEAFCEACERVGIDGVIIPDLPIVEYRSHYQEIMAKHGLHNIFLISPNTSEERIRDIDTWSQGFIYMVSSSSITGAKKRLEKEQLAYFERIDKMKLKKPRLIGFGIADRTSFLKACDHAHGAIIGSALIHQLQEDASAEAINKFITSIKA